jgi:uncharacterized protein RhaS with RHS repeats
MYNPKIGRFISEDPIGFGGGETNLYEYVGNSPTRSVDPTGLSEEDYEQICGRKLVSLVKEKAELKERIKELVRIANQLQKLIGEIRNRLDYLGKLSQTDEVRALEAVLAWALGKLMTIDKAHTKELSEKNERYDSVERQIAIFRDRCPGVSPFLPLEGTQPSNLFPWVPRDSELPQLPEILPRDIL